MSRKLKRFEISYTYKISPSQKSKKVIYATSKVAAKKRFFECKKNQMDNLENGETFDKKLFSITSIDYVEKRWKIKMDKAISNGINTDISIDGISLPVIKWHLERAPHFEAPMYMYMTLKILQDDIELIGQTEEAE